MVGQHEISMETIEVGHGSGIEYWTMLATESEMSSKQSRKGLPGASFWGLRSAHSPYLRLSWHRCFHGLAYINQHSRRMKYQPQSLCGSRWKCELLGT